jgi:hypothetical protein
LSPNEARKFSVFEREMVAPSIDDQIRFTEKGQTSGTSCLITTDRGQQGCRSRKSPKNFTPPSGRDFCPRENFVALLECRLAAASSRAVCETASAQHSSTCCPQVGCSQEFRPLSRLAECSRPTCDEAGPTREIRCRNSSCSRVGLVSGGCRACAE